MSDSTVLSVATTTALTASLLESNRRLDNQVARFADLSAQLAQLMFNVHPAAAATLIQHEHSLGAHHNVANQSSSPSSTSPAQNQKEPTDPCNVLEYVLQHTRRLQTQLKQVFDSDIDTSGKGGWDAESGLWDENTFWKKASAKAGDIQITLSSSDTTTTTPAARTIEEYCRIAEIGYTTAGERLFRQRVDRAGHGAAVDESVRHITKGIQLELSRAKQQLEDTRLQMYQTQRYHQDEMMRAEERAAEAVRQLESKHNRVVAKLESALKAQADAGRERMQRIWESVQLGVAERLSDVRGRDLQRAQVMESLKATLEDERLSSEATFAVDVDVLTNGAGSLAASPEYRSGAGTTTTVGGVHQHQVPHGAATALWGDGASTSRGGATLSVGGETSRPQHPVYDEDPHSVWSPNPQKTTTVLQQQLKEKTAELNVIMAGSSAALRSRTLRWETELRGVISQYEGLLQGQGSSIFNEHVRELENSVRDLTTELTNSKAKCLALERQLQADSARLATALSGPSPRYVSNPGGKSPGAAGSSLFSPPSISVSSSGGGAFFKHTQTDLTGPVVSAAAVEAELRTLRLSGAVVAANEAEIKAGRRASLTFAPFPFDSNRASIAGPDGAASAPGTPGLQQPPPSSPGLPRGFGMSEGARGSTSSTMLSARGSVFARSGSTVAAASDGEGDGEEESRTLPGGGGGDVEGSALESTKVGSRDPSLAERRGTVVPHTPKMDGGGGEEDGGAAVMMLDSTQRLGTTPTKVTRSSGGKQSSVHFLQTLVDDDAQRPGGATQAAAALNQRPPAAQSPPRAAEGSKSLVRKPQPPSKGKRSSSTTAAIPTGGSRSVRNGQKAPSSSNSAAAMKGRSVSARASSDSTSDGTPRDDAKQGGRGQQRRSTGTSSLLQTVGESSVFGGSSVFDPSVDGSWDMAQFTPAQIGGADAIQRFAEEVLSGDGRPPPSPPRSGKRVVSRPTSGGPSSVTRVPSGLIPHQRASSPLSNSGALRTEGHRDDMVYLTDEERAAVMVRQRQLLDVHTVNLGLQSQQQQQQQAHLPLEDNTSLDPSVTTTSTRITTRYSPSSNARDRKGGDGTATVDELLEALLPRVLEPARFFRTICSLAAAVDFSLSPSVHPAGHLQSSASQLRRL